MKKKLSDVFIFILLLFILINLLIKSNSIQHSIQISFDIWKNNLFPSLFPMFVLSEIFISFNFDHYFNKITAPFTTKLFRSHPITGYVMFMGMLTGFPGGARNIHQLYQQKKITKEEASKLLLFTHFSSPLFIINAISMNFLKKKSLAIVIFLSHYLTNIIIGMLLKKYHPSQEQNDLLPEKNTSDNISKTNMGIILSKAIINGINTTLLILGTISIFMCFTTILKSIFDFGEVSNAIICGIIEMSQGLNYISLLNIPLRIKTTLCAMIISFGSFSVHLQIMGVLSGSYIKYLPFLFSRILHAFLSGLIAYTIFPLF